MRKGYVPGIRRLKISESRQSANVCPGGRCASISPLARSRPQACACLRRLIAGLLAICLLIAACSDKDSVPHGILPIGKMSVIMWDMIQADQYAAILSRDTAHVNIRLEHLRLYEQVLQLHEISKEKFKKSYQYYLDNPETNAILYDSLVAQGNRLRTEAYNHPGYKTPTPPATPAATPAVTPPPVPNIPPRGRGIPIIRPFIKPDTAHGKRTKPDSTHLQKHS